MLEMWWLGSAKLFWQVQVEPYSWVRLPDPRLQNVECLKVYVGSCEPPLMDLEEVSDPLHNLLELFKIIHIRGGEALPPSGEEEMLVCGVSSSSTFASCSSKDFLRWRFMRRDRRSR